MHELQRAIDLHLTKQSGGIHLYHRLECGHRESVIVEHRDSGHGIDLEDLVKVDRVLITRPPERIPRDGVYHSAWLVAADVQDVGVVCAAREKRFTQRTSSLQRFGPWYIDALYETSR